MKFNGSYSVENESSSVENELERLKIQALLSWSKEADMLTIYGMNNNTHLLEVGSGPGYVSNLIQKKWPNAKLTTLEIDDQMIHHAKTNVEQPERVKFMEGSIDAIPMDNASVDIVFARFVFQHIEDIDLALKEIYRVLKPGGKLVISEVDPELWGRVSPYEAGLEHLYQKYAYEQAKKGGDRFVVRRLGKMMKDAGLSAIRTDVFSYDSDELDLELFLPQISPERYTPLLEKGIINELEYAHIQAAFNRFLNSSHPYVLLLGVLICGQKEIK